MSEQDHDQEKLAKTCKLTKRGLLNRDKKTYDKVVEIAQKVKLKSEKQSLALNEALSGR